MMNSEEDLVGFAGQVNQWKKDKPGYFVKVGDRECFGTEWPAPFKEGDRVKLSVKKSLLGFFSGKYEIVSAEVSQEATGKPVEGDVPASGSGGSSESSRVEGLIIRQVAVKAAARIASRAVGVDKKKYVLGLAAAFEDWIKR